MKIKNSLILVLFIVSFTDTIGQTNLDFNRGASSYSHTSFYNKTSLTTENKDDEVYTLCEEYNNSATFNLNEVGAYLLNNTDVFDIEPTVLIGTSLGKILKIKNLNSAVTEEVICDNLESSSMIVDIAINSTEDIYIVTYFTGIYRIDSDDCSEHLITDQVSYQVSGANALSFDLNDNLYINEGTSVLRAYSHNLGDFSIWHDFKEGRSSGDFVVLNDKMYIAWNLSGQDHLFEVEIDSNYNYISHKDLGVLPNDTYGLASELGTLYGVTPYQLYRINLDDFSFSTITANNSDTGGWWGAAGLHEAIDIDIEFYETSADILSGNSINTEDFFTETTTLYAVINNTLTNDTITIEVNLLVSLLPETITVSDVSNCGPYKLPPLNNGTYYTETNRGGEMLSSGDIIYKSTELFVYYETNTDPSCASEDNFYIEISEPSKFLTPNNDDENDVWSPFCSSLEYSEGDFFIFDRFGKMVYNSNSTQNGWDGTYNSKQLPSGGYWYKVIYANGKELIGSLSLIRR